ncbi:MAG: hypothetical protein WCY93_04435 [Anaerolineaceae bacterium]
MAADGDAATQEGIFLNGCAAIGTGQTSISRTHHHRVPAGLTEQVLFCTASAQPGRCGTRRICVEKKPLRPM